MRREQFKYDPNDSKQTFLDKLYHDPSYGFVGMQKLYEKAKAIDRRITRKDVKDFFKAGVEIQRFQHQKPKFEQFKIASPNPDSWQIDLAFWFKKTILTCVNINSRLGYATLLQNKQANTVLDALKDFVKVNRPRIVTSDNGKEFMNKAVRAYFKEKKIEHYNNEPGDHATMGKIERFNRTIKQRLMQMPDRQNLTPQLLKAVISNYNNTTHRSIGMTPNEARGQINDKDLEHNKDVLTKVENDISVGTKVLYRLNKGTFDKEDVRWSKAVYEVVGTDGYKVQIRSKNRHTLYKSPNDLKPVNAKVTDAPYKEGDLFEIEKILEHKRNKNGKFRYHIKWVDYDKPTWEPQDNLRLVNKNRMSKPEQKYFRELLKKKEALRKRQLKQRNYTLLLYFVFFLRRRYEGLGFDLNSLL